MHEMPSGEQGHTEYIRKNKLINVNGARYIISAFFFGKHNPLAQIPGCIYLILNIFLHKPLRNLGSLIARIFMSVPS